MRNALGKDYINRCGRTIAFSEKTCKYRVAWAWCGDVRSQVSPLNRMRMYIYIIYIQQVSKETVDTRLGLSCNVLKWGIFPIFLVI